MESKFQFGQADIWTKANIWNVMEPQLFQIYKCLSNWYLGKNQTFGTSWNIQIFWTQMI